MHIPTALVAGLATVVAAHPIQKRALPEPVSDNDVNTLQLALYQEHLELALYTGGYLNFTDAQYRAEGFPPGFRENVKVIADNENIHSVTIESILKKAGKTPVPVCEYRFPYNSPTSFVDLANMITSVGIGAYLGGGSLLRDNPALLTAATSILTVESRHDAYLRTGLGGSPFPSAFDTSLTAVFAYNLARMFVVRCPEELPLPILPKLTLVNPDPTPGKNPDLNPVAAGTPLQFKYDASTFFVEVDESKPLYIGIINRVTNVTYTEATSCGEGCAQIPTPEGAANVGFAVLTTFDDQAALSEDQLTQFGALAGPAEIVFS